jgi:hypothetical protein
MRAIRRRGTYTIDRAEAAAALFRRFLVNWWLVWIAQVLQAVVFIERGI